MSTLRQADEDNDRFGRARQEAELRAYSERAGVDIVGWYVDTISGKRVTRHELDRLLRESPTSEATAVVVSDVDRLGRSVLVCEQVRAELARTGLELHTAVDGLYDLESYDSDDALRYEFKSVMAAHDHRKIVRQMYKAKVVSAERGNLPTNWALFGYTVEYYLDGTRRRKRVSVNELEASVVRRIFGLAASGRSSMEIVRDLLEHGHAGLLTGDEGNYQRKIRRTLHNSSYKGEVVFQFSKTRQEVRVTIPAIVDPELWEAGQAGRRRRPYTDRHELFPLSGILRCGTCGLSMLSRHQWRIRKDGTRYQRGHYSCSHANRSRCEHGAYYRAEAVHEAAGQALARLAASPDEFVREVRAQGPQAEALRLHRELDRFRQDLDRYLRDYELGLLDGPEYARLRRRAQDKLAALEAESAVALPPRIVNTAGAVERLRDLILSGRPMYEVLMASGTRLIMAPGGSLEIVLAAVELS